MILLQIGNVKDINNMRNTRYIYVFDLLNLYFKRIIFFLDKEISFRNMKFWFDKISSKQAELKLINCLIGVVIFAKQRNQY